MSLAEFFVRHFGHRVWLTYKGEYGILSRQRRFTPLVTADSQALEQHRLKSLVAILTHADATTTHYAELFRRHGLDPRKVTSFTELSKLPFLTKEELNRDIDVFLSSVFARSELITSSTGGSSGLSLTFFRDRGAQNVRRAQDYLFNARLGIFPGTKRAWVWGSHIDAFSLRSIKARLANFLTERAIYFYAFDATPDSIDDFLRQLNDYHPRAIIAYPNMLSAMAQRSQAQHIAMTPIPRIIVTAEPLYDWQRKLFEQVFHAETFERYGAREIGTVASECQSHNGMHIFEPSYYLEVIDKDGNPLPPGKMGELVVTDLYNYGMPLIRYRTGDMVTLDDAPCPCGCTWRRITAIGGRVIDMIIRPDGSKVEGLVIITNLRTSGIRVQVQVVQTSPSSLVVRHLIGQPVRDDQQREFKQKISEALGAPIDVTYEPVEHLHYEQSGKYRYVICECDRDRKPIRR